MTTFQDGPAMGKTLMLHRDCRFLRVVKNQLDEIDALDQPKDKPHPNEELFAYEIVSRPGHMHLNMGRGKGGFYPIAEYKLCPTQPSQKVMRSRGQWSSWCETQGIDNPRPELNA